MNDTLPATDLLAITWCPNPALFFRSAHKPIVQLIELRTILLKIYKACDICVLYPEMTQQGNVHIHGKLHIKDKYKWYHSTLPSLKRTGYVCIKTKINKKWDDYITKDLDITLKLFKKYLDENGLTEYYYRLPKELMPQQPCLDILDYFPAV